MKLTTFIFGFLVGAVLADVTYPTNAELQPLMGLRPDRKLGSANAQAAVSAPITDAELGCIEDCLEPAE